MSKIKLLISRFTIQQKRTENMYRETVLPKYELWSTHFKNAVQIDMDATLNKLKLRYFYLRNEK